MLWATLLGSFRESQSSSRSFPPREEIGRRATAPQAQPLFLQNELVDLADKKLVGKASEFLLSKIMSTLLGGCDCNEILPEVRTQKLERSSSPLDVRNRIIESFSQR